MTKIDGNGKRQKVRVQVMVPLWLVTAIYDLNNNKFNENIVNLLIVGLESYKGDGESVHK